MTKIEVPRMFGRQWFRWTIDEITEVLDYFQVEYSSTSRKISLFDFLCQHVVHDRGVNEAAISFRELSDFINRPGSVPKQPMIGARPMLDSDEERDTKRKAMLKGKLKKVIKGNPWRIHKSKSKEIPKGKSKGSQAEQSVLSAGGWHKLPVQNCGICSTELLHTFNTPWRRITPQCSHPSKICLHCLQKHIETQFKMKSWDKIQCPVCTKKMAANDIKAWSTPDFFERYGRVSAVPAAKGGTNFRWCAAPECQNGFDCDPDSGTFVTCDACGRMTCLSCDVEYHEGVSCKEFQEQKAGGESEAVANERDEQEQSSLTEVAQKSTCCPGENCGVPIQLREGCDHMKCKESPSPKLTGCV
jgi:IBR domain, a half RING-finger domain